MVAHGASRRATVAQLERLGERDFDFELVRGALVPVSPGGEEHGALTGMIRRERLARTAGARLVSG